MAFSRTHSQKGFSLLEIMIVTVIIAFLVTFASRRMGKGNREIRKDIRAFAAEVRQLRHKARMNNATYRLVINMPESQSEQQSYWVEVTNKKFLLKSNFFHIFATWKIS